MTRAADDRLPTPDEFRHAIARFPTGVATVTTIADGHDHAMTASSVVSLSLEPPALLFCVAVGSRFHEAVLSAGVWGSRSWVAGSGPSRTGCRPRVDRSSVSSTASRTTADLAPGSPSSRARWPPSSAGPGRRTATVTTRSSSATYSSSTDPTVPAQPWYGTAARTEAWAEQ